MFAHRPSETLRNRSFIGLILSQFLAAFNDQATHIVAIFFAVDMLVRYVGVDLNFLFWHRELADHDVISVVTACFITPFLIFSPLAGPLADRFSKRSILVAWKIAEIGIMALVLVAFLLPHAASFTGISPQLLATISAALAAFGVFLMGTHSAFFVPAKYGAMPEILHHSILSRGNGMLEGTSFTANILGTVFGGVMYGYLKSEIDNGQMVPGREWIIGCVLLGLAVIGAIGSLLIEKLPPASPDKRPRFTENFRVLARSRSLLVAVAGIAFFAFMTLFLRQVLLAKGEAEEELAHQIRAMERAEAKTKPATKPKQEETEKAEAPDDGLVEIVPVQVGSRHDNTELRVALLIGLVGLGVGIGCALAGYLSGKKLELGLVLIGAVMLVITTACLALSVKSSKSMQFCLIMIGAAAGIYIVPMYTMLQHRAPKGSKGNLVAMSNFINVAGGLLSIIVFISMNAILSQVFDLKMQTAEVKADHSLRPAYIEQLKKNPTVAAAEFVGSSVISIAMIALLLKFRPDFIVRTLFWTRTFNREQVNPDGLHHMPEFGPLLVVVNGASADDCLHLASLTDRFARFLVWDGASADGKPTANDPQLGVVRGMGRRVGILFRRSDYAEPRALLETALRTLRDGHVFAIGIPANLENGTAWDFIADVQRELPTPVCPVLCRHETAPPAGPAAPPRLRSITTGNLLKAGSANGAVKDALTELSRTAAG